MGQSDWLTICLSILGILVGAGISWMFYRTQMLADFSALHADVKDLQTKLNLVEQFNNTKEIASMKATIEKLDCNLNSAIKEILSNVKAQQYELAAKIQNEFKSQSDTATNIVRDAFSNEIGKFIKDSKDKEKLLKNLVESFMEGMRVMGEYQRINIEKETSISISDIEQKITSSIEEVLEEVLELKDKFLALPASSKKNK